MFFLVRKSLEREFVQDLINQGYEYLSDLKTPEAMFENVRVQLQILNDVEFTDQKMNNLIKSEADLEIYNKHVVFIFDEAHRSQFGEAQKNINRKFKKYYQFGFTGTPIFPENELTGMMLYLK